MGPKESWRFPSFFSEASNVDNSSVGSLACGRRVISVANLHEAEERVHITSSQGPTRDDRNKPELLAPGTDIVAANGFAGPSDAWIGMTGTSMASPHIAGAAALLYQAGQRTPLEVKATLINTTDNYGWDSASGWGYVNLDSAAT